ncbi:MAG: hypothetical protein DRR16_13955 [Candidatus Parabeggiatoa sp. nov. 3]|jgi:nitric oxide reductase subunit C|nr:MAG: hypothetical protein DRR00_17095 [Gammaproteobacteria bacterium]RKZ61395.1 MAG: hypothetical protein DRQ99_20510 [Gammaproteobacteria bacterium]RKZ84717.1 MAG: hypothetical protein DRR16_13955 [Gammaproteobacteria bacterium]
MNNHKQTVPQWVVWIFSFNVLCFFTQGFLVYSDFPTPEMGTKAQLNELAYQGLNIWRRENCQACHKIHGFGGFLGPDLTNVTQRLSENSLHYRLDQRGYLMPAFHLPQPERLAVIEYLKIINQTGQGTVKPVEGGELPWYIYPTGKINGQ